MSLRTAWSQMIARCYDPKHHKFARYGARGIRVCDRWICYRLFAEDMGERPKGMTLNRINNDGNYSPDNCEWADATTQSQNRHDNRIVVYMGEALCITEWARSLGIRRETLRKRLDLGWDVERAFSEPLRK